MASSNQATVEDSITCIICQELFDDPCLVPCSHTYCRKCIEKMASVNRDQFECPLRDGCKILKKDIDSLALNRAIRDLVELYGSIQRSNLCTNCHLVVAKYACDTCKEEKFCAECYQKEHTSRITQKHQRLAIGETIPELIPCTTHSKKELEYWCYTCETLICIDCLLFKHKDHKYGLIDDVAKEFETKINIHLQAIQSSVEYRINQAEILINVIDNDSKSNRLKLTEVMTSLRKIIDEHETAMVQQILTAEQGQRKQFEDYKSSLKNTLENLNIQKTTYEMLLSSKNHTKLIQVKQGFDDHVSKTNGTLKSLSMPTRTEYCLDGLDQLQTLEQKIIQCGRYVEVPLYCNRQLEKIFADNQTKQELDLSNKNLTDSDMKIVADVLRKSTTLIKLHLNTNRIGHQGAQYIAEALQINQTLTELQLRENRIEQQGAQHIAEALKTNKSLSILHLGNNEIVQQGTQHIAEALNINQTLAELYLESNEIGEEGAQYIAEALKINQKLTVLYLGSNGIGHKGAQHIAETLKTNKTLTKLYLTENQIEQQGAQHIAEVLATNKTLMELSISLNKIGPDGAQHIAEALKINQTLTILYLRENQIRQQGAQHIAEALKINQTLSTLYLGGNEIGDQGAQHIAETLKINQILSTLYLGGNEIGDQGAQHIAQALKINQTLTDLYVGDNKIGQEGLQRVKETLKVNRKLTVYW